ncbi:MAG: ABC transporter transmembrane domain-containing protein [Rhodobacteraceae bacterium]|nr:ABC transporter transmembrane domain-containing protein [Paracoccaceae bacterium]
MTKLRPFLKPYTQLSLLALIVLIITAVLTLSLPLFARLIIDGIAAGNLPFFDRYGFLGLVVAISIGVGSALRYTLVSRLGEKVVVDIRKAVFAHLIGLSQEFFEKTMSGEILSRLNTDTTLVLTVISSSFSIAIRSILLLIGGLVMLIVTSPKLTMMTLILVPLVLVPVLILSQRLKVLSRENQDEMARGAGNISEVLLAVSTIQANNHETQSQMRFNELSDSYLKSANQRITIRGLLTMLIISLVFSAVSIVIWIGVRDVFSGTISAGELTQFVIYSVMVGGTVSSLSEVWGELLRASGATERLIELLEVEDSVKDPVTPLLLPPSIQGTIEFRGVSFCYPSRTDVSALKDINLKIKPNETVAIVGPSGAGKSTLFQLIFRFFDPQAGDILIDGSDIKSLHKQDLRSVLALVPQDPVIFSESARENIRFGRPEATNEEVEMASKAAQAHSFLSSFPDGYDTLLGERGILLSGGQKQRIAIARSLLRNTPILLLDEATSSLDAESEKGVQEALRSVSGQCTMIIIAHRLATVQIANRIIVFDKGEVVAEGTHASLLKEKGLYSRLANLQFLNHNA